MLRMCSFLGNPMSRRTSWSLTSMCREEKSFCRVRAGATLPKSTVVPAQSSTTASNRSANTVCGGTPGFNSFNGYSHFVHGLFCEGERHRHSDPAGDGQYPHVIGWSKGEPRVPGMARI